MNILVAAPGLARELTWAIVGLSVGGVILRPWGVREVIPAVAGAVALVVLGLLPVGAALRGVGQGTDVYLSLIHIFLPQVCGFVVGVVDGDDEFVFRQAKILGQQGPGVEDGLFLEIVAEGEVTQHLERCV